MKTVSFCFVIAGLLLASAAAVHSQPYTFTTIAGLAGQIGSVDGTNGDARFNRPYSIAMDSVGSFYVGDITVGAAGIRKITPVGTNWVVSTLHCIDEATGNTTSFAFPCGIAIDPAGNLYVSDTGYHTVRKLTAVGTSWVVSTIAGVSGRAGDPFDPNPAKLLNQPEGLARDGAGNLYVADWGNNIIRKITPAGTNWVLSTVAESAGVRSPRGVAVDSVGNLYVGDTGNYKIWKFTPVGTNWVRSLVAGSSLYVGSADGTNGSARFFSPAGVTVDSAGNLYVADTGNSTIRKITPVGTNWVVSTLGGWAPHRGAADGTGTNSLFSEPYDLAVDGGGKVYVADFGNNTIRVGQFLPALQLSLSADQAILSWPAAATNFLLETSDSLSPGASWTATTNIVAAVEDSFVVTNNMNAAAAFYRLHKP